MEVINEMGCNADPEYLLSKWKTGFSSHLNVTNDQQDDSMPIFRQNIMGDPDVAVLLNKSIEFAGVVKGIHGARLG